MKYLQTLLLASLAAFLIGCAGFNSNLPSRCPRDGDLMELVGSGLGQDGKGKYSVVVLRCVRLSCQNEIWTTNYYELATAGKAKASLKSGGVAVQPMFIYRPTFAAPK